MARFDVDYPHVRENADIVAVLAHYDIEVQGKGEQRKGLCPFHDDTKPSLNVNTAKNVFKCHACGSGGNIIKLVQLLDDSKSNPRLAALKIAEVSGIGARPGGDPVMKPALKLGQKHGTKKPALTVVADAEPEPETPAEVEMELGGEPFNRPLSFELKLVSVPPDGDTAVQHFIKSRGLPFEHLEELGIGLATRGSMADRLAIPIRNKDGELVAYCGRDVGLLEGDDEPKYKLPDKFRKDLELYGWDTAQQFDQVVIVESFLSVIRHGAVAARAGFGMVSVMGTRISDAQVALLAETGCSAIVCFDGDEAGLIAAPVVAGAIANGGVWVKNCSYSNGSKPHMEDSEVFCRRLGMI